MNSSNNATQLRLPKCNQNIQVYVRVRPLNHRERMIRSTEVIDVHQPKEIVARHIADTKLTKKFTFDRTFGPDSKQNEVYETVVAPLIEEVLAGYNCTVFAYGQTGTGKTHTMVGTECAETKSSWDDDSDIGIIPRALSHLFDELRMLELEFSMRISYLEIYNEELCDLLSSEDATKIRIFDDSTKKGSVIIQGLEEIPVHNKHDVYKLLEKGKERRKTATTLMNDQSSRSHTVFSILVHIKENGIDGEEMLKIGKLNLVDLAGSENVSKAGNEKGIRTRETVNINQSLLTLGRVITALVERTPHIPYRESKLTRLLQESLGGRTKTSIIATVSPGHKDLEETLSTLEYAHRAKNIQNKPEVNQKLTKKTVLKEYTEEIDKLKRELMAAREKNGIYMPEDAYNDMLYKLDSQNRELNEKMVLLKALKDELANKEKIFTEVSLNLVDKTEILMRKEQDLCKAQGELQLTKKVLNTTKRRYKEKKVLLDSHMQTEEILKTQATQLIEVADIATSDTDKLHDTIERRRDVDIKIQSACELFSNRIQESFQMMDDNLKNLQRDHSSYSKLITDGITKHKNTQKTFLTQALDGIDQISSTYVNSLGSLESCVIKNLQLLCGSNADYQTLLQSITLAMRQKEDELKQNFNQHLHGLRASFAEQLTEVNSIHRQVTHKLSDSDNALRMHTESLGQRLRKSADEFKTSFEKEVSNLNTNIQSRQEVAVCRQGIMDEFFKQMQELAEKDKILTDSVKDVVVNLEIQKKQVQNVVDRELTSAKEFSNATGKIYNALQEISDNATKFVQANIETATGSLTEVSNQQNSIRHELADNITKIENCTVENGKQLVDILKSHRNEFDEINKKFSADFSAGCNEVRSNMKESNCLLNEHNTQNAAFTSTLDSYVRDFASLNAKHINQATEEVKSFCTKEVKTYTPTGQTPSKREFTYPKVLATTAPHSQIVKRIRQETNWADVDITITEDPESSGELAESVFILNSTPIQENFTLTEKCDQDTITNDIKKDLTNLLSTKISRNHSRPSSRKNSPVLMPYTKDNKENLAQ